MNSNYYTAKTLLMQVYREETGKKGAFRKEGTLVIFALWRVVLLRSYMMLRIVILSFGQF